MESRGIEIGKKIYQVNIIYPAKLTFKYETEAKDSHKYTKTKKIHS